MDARSGFPCWPSPPGLLQLTAVLCLTLSLVVSGSRGAGMINASDSTVNPPPPRTSTRVDTSTRIYAWQKAASNTSAAGMFTFNRPGRSFVEYRHVWPSPSLVVHLNLRLSFRTVRSSSILAVLSSISERPARPERSNGSVLLPTTLIRLRRGTVHVSVTDQPDGVAAPAQSSIIIGRGPLLTYFPFPMLFSSVRDILASSFSSCRSCVKLLVNSVTDWHNCGADVHLFVVAVRSGCRLATFSVPCTCVKCVSFLQ